MLNLFSYFCKEKEKMNIPMCIYILVYSYIFFYIYNRNLFQSKMLSWNICLFFLSIWEALGTKERSLQITYQDEKMKGGIVFNKIGILHLYTSQYYINLKIDVGNYIN